MAKKQKKKPLYLHPTQLEVYQDTHKYQVLCASRRWGKALDLDTRIFTENRGWVTMATIKEGDRVYSPSGKSVEVIKKSEVFEEEAYKITLNDKSTIIAGANHEWLVNTFANRCRNRRNPLSRFKRTTEEMSKDFKIKKEFNYSIDVNLPLRMETSQLLIPPYVMGVMVCSGNRDGELRLNRRAGIYEHLTRLGYKLEKKGAASYYCEELSEIIKEIHNASEIVIPHQYLKANVAQRIDLIRGIFDSKARLQEQENKIFLTFYGTPILARITLFVLRSLGVIVTVNTKFTKKGQVKISNINLSMKIPFFIPYRNPDKKERCREYFHKRSKRKNKYFLAHRLISNIEPIGVRKVQCIQIKNWDGLWLAGEELITTHNSRLILTKIVAKAINFTGHYDPLSPPVCLLTLPTLKQARQIHWKPLQTLLENHPAVHRVYKTDFRIAMKGARPDILLRGCNEDSGDYLRGLKIYFAAMDEIQDIKPIVWEEAVNPAMADTQGSSALFCGCVNPETLILSDKGYKRIKEFNPGGVRPKELVPISAKLWGLNKEYHEADNFFNNGTVPTKKIKTYNGYTLEGSLNHPVLTKTGWVELKDLTKQHKVAIDYGSDIWGEENPGRYYNSDKYVHRNLHTYVVPKNTDLDIKLMYMIGYFLQKGRYSVNTKTGKIEFEFYLQNKNKRAETFWVHSSFLGSQFKKEIVRKDRNPVIKTASPVILGYLEHLKLGLENKVEDREIPDWIFRVPRELVISFLKGAFDSNGAILSINNKARSRILFYSRSERIAKTVQLLLLNLGIISKFKKEINRDNVTGEAPEYKHSLTIRGDSFNKFKEILGFKYSKYAEVLKKMKVCNYQNRYKVDDIYLWDKVIEVEESESLTYDFTVPNTNSYIGNGIVCHNTPKGKGTFFHQLYELEKTSPDWKSFHFTVYDNPFIPREEIERMKAIKSPKVFSQELMANWESFDAQMWTEMNSSHIIPHSELPSSYEEVLLGIDWGDVNPALIVAGYYNNVYYIIDYWENPNKGRPIEQHIHNKEAMRLVNEHYVSSSYADPSRPGFIMSMRRAGIPRLVSGYNRISEGNNVVNNLFYQNRIRISSKCQRVYDVFSAYHRAKKEEQILDEPAKFQDDHLCFVANTEIMTLEGWGKIQDIKIGDYVWTTKAWQPVISCMNRMASIITLQEIQHGGLLRCTPDHPFIQIDKRGRHIQHKAIDLHPGIYLKALDKKPDKPKLKVLPGEGRDMVYNITVKNAPEYYVRVQEHNGVLVHNCDAFRYIMATRHIRTLDKEMLQQPIQHRKEEEEVWETNSTLFSQD